MAHQINIPGTNNGEVKTFTVNDNGDPSCGLPASQYEFSGGFYFDEIEYLENFKADLVKLLDNYGFIQGKARVETDVENQSRMELEHQEATRASIEAGGGCSVCGDLSGFECICEDDDDEDDERDSLWHDEWERDSFGANG